MPVSVTEVLDNDACKVSPATITTCMAVFGKTCAASDEPLWRLVFEQGPDECVSAAGSLLAFLRHVGGQCLLGGVMSGDPR